ncbi:hypothetical protein AB0F91_26250 [Amycolatopsis sp. NPDC023774]|uniref:hypothetical protein n=1 Tax=Amycolatopsis sp. NPDC023774 TaxID=3155015 RepID=UPI0033C688F9
MRVLELEIHQVDVVDENEVAVTLRCLLGPARLGARFDRIRPEPEGAGFDLVRESGAALDLELTRILFRGRDLDALDPGLTALVALRGTGTHLLRPATQTSWRILQGSNPP